MKQTWFKKIIISIPSLTFWIAVAVFDHSLHTAVALIAAALHELAHVIVIKICGINIKGVCVLPYGLEIATDNAPSSFWADIAISSAGCVANYLCAILFYAFGVILGGGVREFALMLSAASLMLGMLNSLPISTLDGGCVLEAALSLVLPMNTAYAALRAVSFIFLLVLWVIAVYIFMFSGYNYSLFAMAIWLFARLFCEQKS